MNGKIENLKDLFLEQGRELYNAAMLSQKELPLIRKAASSPKLRNVIDRELITAKRETDRIKSVFKNMHEDPLGEKSECCEAVLNHSKKMIKRSPDPKVRDAVIINSIQRLNHNKITGFGSMASYAKEIGKETFADSLYQALLEEKALDKELSILAESEINHNAVAAFA